MAYILSSFFLFLPFINNIHAYEWTNYHSNDEIESILSEINEKCQKISFFYHLQTSETEMTSRGNKLYVLAFGEPPDRHKAGKFEVMI